MAATIREIPLVLSVICVGGVILVESIKIKSMLMSACEFFPQNTPCLFLQIIPTLWCTFIERFVVVTQVHIVKH